MCFCAAAPMPAQDLSGLEEQLRQITNQIETLRYPGVEEAINALRAELGEIGHALGEAMPRQSIDTIERQIQGLSQRIAEGRQAGVDHGALAGMVIGAATVLFWIYVPVVDGKALSSYVYEIIPGFILCTLAIIVVSLATAKPAQELEDTFDEMERQLDQ